jgi:predicted ester cyclase
MSIEDNKAVVQRLIAEVWGAQRFEVLAELMAPERAAATRQIVTELHAALPDWHHTIELQVAEGEWVVTRCTGRGTHRGEWRGLPATGRAVTNPEVHFHRLVGGKIVAGAPTTDARPFLEQLGAPPPRRATPPRSAGGRRRSGR